MHLLPEVNDIVSGC